MAKPPPKLEDVSQILDSGIVQGEELSRSEGVSNQPAYEGASNSVDIHPVGLPESLSAHVHVDDSLASHITTEVAHPTDNDASSTFVTHNGFSLAATTSSARATQTELNDLKAQLAEKNNEIQELKKDNEKLAQEKDEIESKYRQDRRNSLQKLQGTMRRNKLIQESNNQEIRMLKSKIAEIERGVKKDENTISDKLENLKISEDQNPAKATASASLPIENPFLCIQHMPKDKERDQHMEDEEKDQYMEDREKNQHMEDGEKDQHMEDGEKDQHMEDGEKDQHMEDGEKDQIKAKYITDLKELLNNTKTIDIRILKLFLVGPPSVGKTTTRDRLLKEIVNIAEAGKGRVVQSTLLANCNQVLVSVSGDKWHHSKTVQEEAQLIFALIKELLDKDQVDASVTPPMETSSSAQAPVQETTQSEIEPEALTKLREIISSGNYSQFESLNGNTILNIHDIGGQPGFLEMLPSLIHGPATYLLCFNMSEDLQKHCEIRFSRHDLNNSEEITPYKSAHSVVATISQILSSIVSIQCTLSELAPPEIQKLPGFSKIFFGRLKQTPPAAAFVGTHKDKVSDHEYSEKEKKINKMLHHLTSIFPESKIHFMCPSKEGSEFFPVDNMNGIDSDDVAPLRSLISLLFRTHFENASLPIHPSWLLFGIALRNQYSIATMSDCFKLGDVLHMSNEEVKLCLWYLHFCAGTLMYYPDLHLSDKWFKDHVICSPQVVFDSISQLILAPLCVFHSKSGDITVYKHHKKSWLEKGQFSVKCIKAYCSAAALEDSKLIPVEKLIKLLKHVNLLSPISSSLVDVNDQTMYFMPAVLECATQDELTKASEPDKNNPEPLFITFDCGYVPTGVFCGLITRIVFWGPKNILGLKWELRQVGACVKRDCISFVVDDCDLVTLLSHAKCYEIRIVCKQKDGSLHELCTYVLSIILYVLKSLCLGIAPVVAFKCPCPDHKGQDISQSLCSMKNFRHFTCDTKKESVVLSEYQEIWIGEHVALGTPQEFKMLVDTHAEGDFTFNWSRTKKGSKSPTKIASIQSTLTFKSVTEEDIGYYQCEIKENKSGIVFTTFRALFMKDETYSKKAAQMPVTTVTLDSEIESHNMISLAEFFDKVDDYLDVLELNKGEQTDVRSKAQVVGTRSAMNMALKLWHTRVTSEATYNKLIDIVHSLGKEEIAEKIKKYFVDIIMKQ